MTKMTKIKQKRQFVVCLHKCVYRTGLNRIHHIKTGESQDSLGQRWSAEAGQQDAYRGKKICR